MYIYVCVYIYLYINIYIYIRVCVCDFILQAAFLELAHGEFGNL